MKDSQLCLLIANIFIAGGVLTDNLTSAICFLLLSFLWLFGAIMYMFKELSEEKETKDAMKFIIDEIVESNKKDGKRKDKHRRV